MKTVTRKSWKEFRESGLLWFINSTLHLFGGAIVVEVDKENNVTNAWPAKVIFRGFDEKSTTEGYQKVTNYLADNIKELKDEVNE